MCERIDNYLVFSLVYSNRKLAYNKHCAIKLYGIYGNFKITNFHDYERGITGIFKRIKNGPNCCWALYRFGIFYNCMYQNLLM